MICRGLAKTFQLRCSGVRNWLGQVLLLRNNEWVNGCIPGLCVALAGSNSDVKPNDRLPILECTHEKLCKKKRCLVKKNNTLKTSYNTQRTQSLTTGYFGGYIGKRQPAGALETKKCVDKLYTLRAKYQGRGKAGQLRAASGRLITDLEMNSTYRGAVEIFNLCRNLKQSDVLSAECIRTFGTETLDGGPWMYQLESQTYIPPTKKPSVRTNRSRANARDIYAFRPLTTPWKLLSAYEFFMFWKSEPVMTPNFYENLDGQPRSVWTEAGKILANSQEYKEGKIVAKPLIHYTVLECTDEDAYFTFPEEPKNIYETFRHCWILVRKPRPQVVVIENLKMPSASRTATYNAQYGSLFFRPWTLLEGVPRVPHLRELSMVQAAREQITTRLTVKTNTPERLSKKTETSKDDEALKIEAKITWVEAWEEYVRGHIVSKYARNLIQSFLLKTVAASGHVPDENESDADDPYEDPDIPALRLPASALEKFLNPMLSGNVDMEQNRDEEDIDCQATTAGKLKKVVRKKMKDMDYQRSMLLGCNLWQTPKTTEAADERTKPGHMFPDSVEDHLAAVKIKEPHVLQKDAPFEENRHRAAMWYEGKASRNIDDVLQRIMTREKKPNLKQSQFLTHFAKRLKLEALEMRLGTVNNSTHEPLLDLIHGFPGTGKSEVILWMRELMEEGLGW